MTSTTTTSSSSPISSLSPEDIYFIRSEEALAQTGFPDEDDSTDFFVDPGSPFSGANTKEKWDSLNMDDWLEKYVKTVDISGQPGKKLIDSTNFFSDFWLSTVKRTFDVYWNHALMMSEQGEENIVVCNTLYDSCNVADISDEKRYAYISRDDALRAQFVRQVLKVWQSANKQAFDVRCIRQ